MASTLPRLLSRQLRTSSPLHRVSQTSIPRNFPTSSTFRASARRGYTSSGPGNNPIKIWPFLAIIATGTGAYALMVNSRAEMPPTTGRISAPKKNTPTFSPSKVIVLFVLGGPGAGKGTQCAKLVEDYKFTHLSAGDLLRAEQDREGSEFGDLIKSYIKDGKIVPMEVTVQLLENAMTDAIEKNKEGKGKFLIDGFPRKMDQALKFEETVCPSRFVLFFDCPEAEMQKRLLERGKTSGRSDDNEESIKKRFKTFVETSMPVVDYFKEKGKVIHVVATKSPDDVYKETKGQLEERLGKKF